jgi:hypothetical protein
VGRLSSRVTIEAAVGLEKSVLEAPGGAYRYVDWTSATPKLVKSLRSSSAVEFA